MERPLRARRVAVYRSDQFVGGGLDWALADDAGNRYRLVHLSSGKGELLRTETAHYQPPVHDAARRLLLTVPSRATEGDVVIDLPGGDV